MMLAGFLGVVFGLNVVAVRHVGMMTGSFVVTCFVVLGGFMMMLRCVFRHLYVGPRCENT
jgi:hypothetical protein